MPEPIQARSPEELMSEFRDRIKEQTLPPGYTIVDSNWWFEQAMASLLMWAAEEVSGENFCSNCIGSYKTCRYLIDLANSLGKKE